MGFSVETLGCYALFLPLMAALGYDRMVTSAMVIIGALIGVTASTVNPFSIGVAAREAGVSIGDGIVLRLFLWFLLTSISIAYVVRYAEKVRRDPTASLVGFDEPDLASADDAGPAGPAGAAEMLTRTQKWVLAVTGAALGLMILSVIPWSSIFGADTGPAGEAHQDKLLRRPVVHESCPPLSRWSMPRRGP